MDRRRLRAPNDVQDDGLVSVAAQATDLKIGVARIERIAERWTFLPAARRDKSHDLGWD
jgi:hypothetical protein